MGFWDNIASRQFAKDEAGRLVFLPRGPRKSGYVVPATDEDKFKSLVKVYLVASMLINLTGSTASIVIAQSLAGDHPAPLASKLEFGLVVYAISAALLYFGPWFMLWLIYRGAVDKLCSSLPAVAPSSFRQNSKSNRTVIFLLFAGLFFVALGIFFLVGYRH
jgi:hypothetical protein